jgi:hypothetical protein
MIKNLLAIGILLLSSAASFASTKETLLLERSYKLKVSAGSFECYNGIPPNGHNYPVYTSLIFKLPSYNLWLGNVWTNVHEYMGEVGYAPCSDFAKLLRPAHEQDLIATVTQKITERHHKNGFKQCMRATREEATLVVNGVNMRAVNEFLVGPVSDSLCK